MLTVFRKQPRAFYTIFMLEIWERFGFYTIQGVFILFFIRHLQFSDREAYYIFGAFSALVYGMVALGGYLGDQILGTKRSIVLGLVVLALGYLSLSFVGKAQVYQALGLICVGNGVFKANPSSLLARAYRKNDLRLHSGFTFYYMAVNIGSIFALFIGPAVASHFGYGYAFFLSFIGLLLGLVNYYFQRQFLVSIRTAKDEQSIPVWLWAVIFLGLVVLTQISAFLLQHVELSEKLLWLIFILVTGIYFNLARKESKASALRMIVAFILMLEAVAFFSLYQQMPTSLNLFAVNNVNPTLLGLTINPQSFQALNPIWIVLISPVLAMIYYKADERGFYISVPYKFAVGMLCCGLGFCLLFFARYAHNGQGIVTSWWLVGSYFFQSTGELLVSALGLAMVAELVPRRISGFVMGFWYLTTSISGFTGASIASLTALPAQVEPGLESLLIYTKTFAHIGLVTLAIGVLMWLFAAKLTQFIRVKR